MHQDSRVVARGKRLLIRHFMRTDVDEWCDWPQHKDPLFRDYNPPRMSARERDLWYADRRSRPDVALFAIEGCSGRLLGRLFLRQMSEVQGSAVLGVDLRSDILGQGYGTEALRAFNRYYFCEMGYRELKLDVAGYNYRAQRVYTNLGWVPVEGHWSTYPSIILPDVFQLSEYEPIRQFFRAGPGSISIYHHDMELTVERWREIGETSEE